jgi:hypothetical protein
MFIVYIIQAMLSGFLYTIANRNRKCYMEETSFTKQLTAQLTSIHFNIFTS